MNLVREACFTAGLTLPLNAPIVAAAQVIAIRSLRGSHLRCQWFELEGRPLDTGISSIWITPDADNIEINRVQLGYRMPRCRLPKARSL